ncbi:MAG: NAD-dependent epimerase/dehydratase family protein [Candidatus Peribacteraceae bacterium]|nr:NAD-dependent epimerase/dehydratase family protein [Candidatus Peribacteraceae bacterium]
MKMETSGRNVLVTGCSGFIGSYLCPKLREEGWYVIGLDNDKSGQHFVDEFFTHGIQASLLDKINFIPKIDYVIHLAAQTSVYESVENISFDSKCNIYGTINVLDLCKERKVPILYVASAGTCYGQDGGGLIELESCSSIISSDNSPYGLSKQVGEAYCELYHNLFKVDYASLRLANIYGLGGKGVVEKWLEKIALENGKGIYINGDGERTRDYVYIDDAIDVFIRTLNKLKEGNCYPIIANVATCDSYSLNEVADIICEVTGFDVLKNAEVKPEVPYEVTDHELVAQNAKEDLDWTYTIDLDDGIKLIWEKLNE